MDAKPIAIESRLEVQVDTFPKSEVVPASERPVERRNHVPRRNAGELFGRVLVDESKDRAIIDGMVATRSSVEPYQNR
jgi:hypothetical protein